MLPGALEAAGVRWVDQPWSTVRAGNRLIQLQLAYSLGANPPPTVVTNSTAVAEAFVAAGPTVAKTISTGVGLAPFVDHVDMAQVSLVRSAPVTLQRAIYADADWRLVTVGSECFGWRRSRNDDSRIDWRAEDPSGTSFRPSLMNTHMTRLAMAIQNGLGLSFSVQDWLEVGDHWLFLEVNPQGQWLFLDEARESIGLALARHLRGSW